MHTEPQQSESTLLERAGIFAYAAGEEVSYWTRYFTSDVAELLSERDYRYVFIGHVATFGATLASGYEMTRALMPERLAYLGAAVLAGIKTISFALRLGHYHNALNKRQELEKSETFVPSSIGNLLAHLEQFEDQFQAAPLAYHNAILAHSFGPIFESELQMLGFQRIRARVDKQENLFTKENNPSLPTNRFTVVKSGNEQWLLKGLSHDPLQTTFQEIREVAFAREEEVAYRVAACVGYPVPETKRVIFKGRPSIAYRYITNAIDHGLYEDRSKTGMVPKISNPDDLVLRPWFNALIGAFGDSAHQGIVSLDTGYYYANDIRFSLFHTRRELLTDNQDKDLVQLGVSSEPTGNYGLNYGVASPLSASPGVAAFIRNTERLGQDYEYATALMHDCGYAQPELVECLQQRARSVASLMQSRLVDQPAN